MRAYQIKITLKHVKPAVWRSIVVPDYLTFSQFFVVLNIAMGWEGYHLSEFTFPHGVISDPTDFGDFGFEERTDANKTYIRDVLEVKKKYGYIYDMGDNWEHDVTVEKILEDYEYDYPTVLKYKGDCPPEDCGGAYAFNEMKKSDADDDERPTVIPYDIEDTNSYFMEECRPKKNKKDSRTAIDIHRDIAEGKSGFYAKEYANKGRKQNNGSAVGKSDNASITLEEHLNRYSKNDLKRMLTSKGIPFPKGASKPTMVETLLKAMSPYDVMREYFFSLMPWEYDAITDYLKDGVPFDDDAEFMSLEQGGYAFCDEESGSVFPIEVEEALKKFLEEKDVVDGIKKRFWLLNCVLTANIMYGVTPKGVLNQLVLQGEGIDWDPDTTLKKVGEIPRDISTCIIEGGTIVSKELPTKKEDLLRLQGDIPFYIPSASEIEDGIDVCVMGNQPAQSLVHYIMDTLDVPLEEAYTRVLDMGIMANRGLRIDRIFYSAVGEEVIKKEPATDIFINKVRDFSENTRSIVYRGHTAREVEGRPPEDVDFGAESNVVSIDKLRKPKK